MDRSVRYHPLFQGDVVAAAQWYDERLPGLGDDFIMRIQLAISRIIAAPERRSPVDFGLLYWPVDRFPYVVFYDFTDSEIILIGVMHTAQESAKWQARRG